ncbi:MAG TPA: SDR family oxidoreductase [Bryobacteraceae bacterium]|jgi:NAD(P)-dependent dehydrogenase (short-subunit alcohol dehydrogenase family)|nr:SDR family oxidoreductase [Bryobacteraceae bacterium]
MNELFNLAGRVAVITGGAGLLGLKHAEIIAAHGGSPVLVDIADARSRAHDIEDRFGVPALASQTDITNQSAVRRLLEEVLSRFQRVDILVNNAANNPQVGQSGNVNFSRLENFPFEQWCSDLAVGLTGAYLCSQVFGSHMAEAFRDHGRRGVILNIASDLAVIAPDQRIYRQPGLPEHLQPAKPVTYSVVKTGLVGLTRYLATYWAESGVRANAISPGGVYTGQPEAFVQKLASLIPLGRMAHADEYQGAVLFLVSDASSYMTGQNLVCDGGRTAW